MRSLRLAAAMLALLMVVAGCGSQSPRSRTAQSEAAKRATTPTGDGHADVAAIVPGSYEDWCAEHQVPETQCTRCDASLIPAFQVANDWCADHGLPMSQCTIHDPNLRIVRPPKPEGK